MSSSAETPVKPGAAVPRSEFPPMYYDSPVTQVVARVPVKGAGEVEAEITAGGEFFKVDRVQVKVIDDALAELAGGGRLPIGSGPGHTVGNGDGTTVPRPGRVAELSVTAEVPKASAPAPGPFSGTVVVTGPGVNQMVQLGGAYLGTLIGQVTVQPKTAVPGEPVLVRVLRGDGELQSDPAVTVSIAGVTAVSRYYQFPTAGTRTLTVLATRGALRETTEVTVPVTGTPLEFRSSLTTPVVTQCPVLQASPAAGAPYTASFTLGAANILPPSQEAASGDHGKPVQGAVKVPVAGRLSQFAGQDAHANRCAGAAVREGAAHAGHRRGHPLGAAVDEDLGVELDRLGRGRRDRPAGDAGRDRL